MTVTTGSGHARRAFNQFWNQIGSTQVSNNGAPEPRAWPSADWPAGSWSVAGSRTRSATAWNSSFHSRTCDGLLAVESPVDLDSGAVHAPIPGPGLLPKHLQVRNSSGSQALPGEDPNLDLGLIEPASLSGGVMDAEAVPDFPAEFLAEQVGERLPAMNVKVIQHQMDGLGFRVLWFSQTPICLR